MAPILIDSRDLLKLAVISVLSIVFAFSGGYLFGFKQAALDVSYQSDGKYSFSDKTLFESNDQMLEVAELDTNESIKLSQDKTIEKVELAAGQMTAESTITASTTAESIITEPATTEPDATESVSAVPSVTEPLLTVPPSAALEAVNTNDTVKKNNIEEESHVTFNSDVDEPHKSNDNASASSTRNRSANNGSELNAKFTIQVAVYGDLKNAESMMLSLQEKSLDSYVSGYTTKSSKRRFNVRFGYFQKKKMALNALENYIDNHRGDGYLVNFSAENIVSFVKESVVQLKLANPALGNSAK